MVFHHSVADESGGEEILYPRKPNLTNISEETPTYPTSPSAFLSPTRKAKKRSSDEFAFDQMGFPVPKVPTSVTSTKIEKTEKPSLRKHHSIALGSSISATPARERRRGGSVRVSMNPGSPSNHSLSQGSRHSRQQSANSPSFSRTEFNHSHHQPQSDADNHSHKDSPVSSTSKSAKRTSSHSTDPGSEKALSSKDKELYSSPNVAHSLLRGTQEGWSGLDDEATAEALRKLDGISGKGARARGSVGFYSRTSNHSRPSSPASRGHRSDGTEASEKPRHGVEGIANISSGRYRESGKSTFATVEKENSDVVVLPKGDISDVHKEGDAKQPGSELGEHAEARNLGSNVRLSLTAKRSSVSSTNYAGTPTSSSRDSALSSVATSATSASVISNRSSLKAKRNSAGSDISSVNSNDALKERLLASSSTAAEIPENNCVPPVPPLPKDLSSYKTPPQSTTSAVFTPLETSSKPEDQEKSRIKSTSIVENQHAERFLDSTTGAVAQGTHDYPELSEPSPAPAIVKSPSKKWSFSNPLNLRRSTSPSRRDLQSVKSPASSSRTSLTNRQLRHSSSKGSPLQSTLSPKSSVEAWKTIRDGAMTSETSLVSLSSLSSLPEPSPPLSPVQYSATQHDLDARATSRADTESSVSAGHAFLSDQQSIRGNPHVKSQPEVADKRLTPSSIPFFRRSSSQSMHISPSQTGFAVTSSPTFSSAPDVHHASLRTNTFSQDAGASPSIPSFSQRKSSMLSLGFPSILKGSGSRKNLQPDKSNTASRMYDKAKKSKESDENLKVKKDDKDRSESRISVLMGRKRGKVSLTYYLGSLIHLVSRLSHPLIRKR